MTNLIFSEIFKKTFLEREQNGGLRNGVYNSAVHVEFAISAGGFLQRQ